MKGILKLSRYTFRRASVIFLVLIVAFSALSVAAVRSDSDYYGQISALRVLWPAFAASVILPMFITLSAFSHLRSQSEGDMYGALPFKNGTKFISCVGTSFFICAAGVSFLYALTLASAEMFTDFWISGQKLIYAYAVFILLALSSVLCTALCCTLYDTVTSVVIGSATLTVAPALVLHSLFGMVLAGVGRYSFNSLFENINIIGLVLFGSSWTYTKSLSEDFLPEYITIMYILCSIILFVIGFCFYTKPRERKWLRHLPCAMWLGYTLFEAAAYGYVCKYGDIVPYNMFFHNYYGSLAMSVFSVAVCFAFDRVLNKSTRRTAVVIGVTVAVSILLSVILWAGGVRFNVISE